MVIHIRRRVELLGSNSRTQQQPSTATATLFASLSDNGRYRYQSGGRA